MNGLSQAIAGFDLAANTDTLIFTGVSARSSVNVNFCNRGTDDVRIRIARGRGASPATTDYVEYQTRVGATTAFLRTGLLCSVGDKVWVRTDLPTVTVQVEGVE